MSEATGPGFFALPNLAPEKKKLKFGGVDSMRTAALLFWSNQCLKCNVCQTHT